MEFVFSVKVKALAYYKQQGLITIGFHDGKIENFKLIIEPEREHSYTERSMAVNLLVTKTFT